MSEETQTLIEALRDGLSEGSVRTDPGERHYFSRDLSFGEYEPAVAVIQPGTVEELSGAVKRVQSAGYSIVPRGGGMSYTRGYTPERSQSVVVDTRGMNDVVEINAEDRYVTVQAGCTWETLHDVLREEGLRTPFWGPLSGRFATVGGSLSQNCLFYGSARHGSLAENVLSLEVVLSGGRILRTGSASNPFAKPFYRYYGPDLTGLFLGDTGAFGIKTRATLPLLEYPPVTRTFSRAFDDYDQMIRAQVQLTRRRGASELFGFGPFYHRGFTRRGFEEFADVDWSLHGVVDGFREDEVERTVQRLEREAEEHGTPLDTGLPGAIRSNPFGSVSSTLLGPEGEIWLPVHTVLPPSQAREGMRACEEFFDVHREALEEHGIMHSYLTVSSGTGVVLEPSFYWKDELGDLRLDHVGEEKAAEWESRPPDPDARRTVLDLREELGEKFLEWGGVPLQIGKYYPYRENLEDCARRVLGEVGSVLDPRGLMNPGALGLNQQQEDPADEGAVRNTAS